MGGLYGPLKAARKPPVILGNNVRRKLYVTSQKVLLNYRSGFIQVTEHYADANKKRPDTVYHDSQWKAEKNSSRSRHTCADGQTSSSL